MATHSSTLAWKIPGTGAWWAAIYGVAQSRTQLKQLSSNHYTTRELLKTVFFYQLYYSLLPEKWARKGIFNLLLQMRKSKVRGIQCNGLVPRSPVSDFRLSAHPCPSSLMTLMSSFDPCHHH